MRYFTLAVFCFLIASCQHRMLGIADMKTAPTPPAAPNYANLNYWAAHPWKKDFSDSVPMPLRKFSRDSVADVFFIYPTSFYQKNETAWNAQLDNEALNKKTDETSILYQATVFNEHCRVFSPRYRQAHLRAFFTKDSKEAAAAFELAYEDVSAAFEYYLHHFNNGRPFIIASHSQGTLHAARLIRQYIDGKALYNRFICAYLPGLPVPENYFTNVGECTGPRQTGCVTSWRTYREGYIEPVFVSKESFKAIVSNPLTWTSVDSAAPASFNNGAILKNFNRMIPHVCSARVHGNVLWVSRPKFAFSWLIRTKNYHIGDINLFYLNIRQNVAGRIAAFINTTDQHF